MQQIHYGILVDSEKPITGVATNNRIEFLDEELMEGVDLAFKRHCEECSGRCSGCKCSHEGGECSCEECAGYEPTGEHDLCAPEERGTTLIGGWKETVDGQYEPDTDSEYSAIVGDFYTQVLWSRHTKRVSLCSPCYPGQGDLESDGDQLAFDLPPDLVGEGR